MAKATALDIKVISAVRLGMTYSLEPAYVFHDPIKNTTRDIEIVYVSGVFSYGPVVSYTSLLPTQETSVFENDWLGIVLSHTELTSEYYGRACHQAALNKLGYDEIVYGRELMFSMLQYSWQ